MSRLSTSHTACWMAFTAALGLTTSAHADMVFKPADDLSLTVYGTLDFSLAYQNKSGGPGNAYAPTDKSWLGIIGGNEYTNKIGLKSEYALFEDTVVGFDLAGTVSTNSGTTGNSQPALALFNERFNVFLRNSTGTYIVGEQMDPAWLATIRGDNRSARQSLDPIAGAWSVAQGTQSAPQTNMKPTNSLGYANKFGKTSVGLLYKPYTNQNGGTGLGNTESAGSQASAGLTYDDGTYLFTSGYMVHHGIGGTQSAAVDIVNKSVALGYSAGAWSYKAGYLSVNSPVGIITGGTIFSGWNTSAAPLNTASAIKVKHAGFKWKTDDKNTLSLTYYDVGDKLNTKNTAQWLVLGDNYQLTKRLMIYGNLGIVKAGAGANPLTAGTGPNNVAKPDTVTTAVNTGFTFFF